MRLLVALPSLLLIAAICIDAFESVLLPRRVTHAYRLIRLFYRTSWRLWRKLADAIRDPRRRQSTMALFGPLSLLFLFSLWAVGLIVAFGFLNWSLQIPLNPATSSGSIRSYIYLSGVTFFTLGYGDLAPVSTLGRFLAVAEAGLGFGFLAMIIGYHPVLTQSFSRREITISLLDARGGSPPTAAQILARSRQSTGADLLHSYFVEWETWAAELLESCLSYPMLAYYRSQHDNQSWLAALTAILDTSALEICGLELSNGYQARLTFAIARHAAVDLALVFKIKQARSMPDRLGPPEMEKLQNVLKSAGIHFSEEDDWRARLTELRSMYEPFVQSLSDYFQFPLPGFSPAGTKADNWQTSAWMPRTPGIRELQRLERGEHFE